MPEFVLNRAAILDGKGHKIRFEKGTPTWVPPELAREAVAIGAEILEGTVHMGEDITEVPVEQLTADDKQSLMFVAFEEVIKKNDSKDFDGAGKPTVEALKKIVDFNFSKSERDTLWRKYREAKAAETV